MIGLFIVNAYVITLLKGNSMLAAFWLLRTFEFFIVYYFIQIEILPKKRVVKILLFGALFQIAWAITQYQLNSSVGLSWLGESILNPEIKGVAKIDLADGAKQIRAYGSFLHPNILGFYLMTVFLLILQYLKKMSWIFWLIIFGVGIYFTGSLAAMIGISSGFILYGAYDKFCLKKQEEKLPTKTNKYLIWLTAIVIGLMNLLTVLSPNLINVQDPSWQERLIQIDISKKMVLNNPLGSGVGNFTLEMEKYSTEKLKPWDFQPVHNIYYLIANETGLQGLLILLVVVTLITYFYWSSIGSIFLLIFLLMGSFDHLLWTSWSAWIVLAIVAGLFTSKSISSEQINPS